MMTEEDFRKEVDKIIDEAPEHMKKKLIGLQWKCDIIKDLYKDNDTYRMLVLFNLMMDSLKDLNDILNGNKSVKVQQKENKVINMGDYINE